MSIWNYVVSAHKPTTVTHSVVGSFTGPEDQNLIIAKCTRIEIHLLQPHGLQPVVDVPIYGRIASMNLFRLPNESKDVLFISTERYKFCVLEYDPATKELKTRAHGDVSDRIGRPTDCGQIGIIDPDCRVIGLHLYDGLFKVIPIDPKGHLKEAYSMRLEELQVIDMKFLYGCERPTVAVLYQDNKDSRHVKTYEVSQKDKELTEGPWLQNNVEMGASMLIPVPMPLGGAIIVGETLIVYHNGTSFKAIQIPPAIIVAYGQVDPNGNRFLLGDNVGTLFLLGIEQDTDGKIHMKLELLGPVSPPSTISYLDGGAVFIGSHYADSQVVRLMETKQPDGSYLEIVQSFVNLGPIVDLCVVDLERQGQGQVITCSGAFNHGSLRVVRNGIGINEQAALELDGMKGLWSLRKSSAAEFDTFLVVTFVSETRILAINDEDELEEFDFPGFNAETQTLLTSNVVHDQIIQVTSEEVRLVEAVSFTQVHSWKAPQGVSINVASATATQVLLATGGGTVVYIAVGPQSLTEVKHITLEHEVACLDISSLPDFHPTRDDADEDGDAKVTDAKEESDAKAMEEDGAGSSAVAATAAGAGGGGGGVGGGKPAEYAVVGMWTDMSVRVLRVPSLEVIHVEKLGGEIIPRSILLCPLQGVPYLLCALGDGHLFSFTFNTVTGALQDRKKVSLGTLPMELKPFNSRGQLHVFAASDRPTVIHSSNGKLLFSNVNLREVTHVAPFHCASFPESLALAKEEELTIGAIDDIQKLHIRTIPLGGEQARRICHHEPSRTLAVCTSKNSLLNGEEGEESFIRLFSDTTFDNIATLPLHSFECGCSIITCQFLDDTNTYIVVGTAYVFAEESEPSKGRILVLSSEAGKLQVVAEKETKGAVYNLNSFNGKLLAGINQKVQLFRWVAREDLKVMGGTARELQAECSHHGHILALYVRCRGDFVVVGDLMKSMSLLMYKQEEGVLELRARDFNANWMTAVDILDDDVYIGAENSFNLFTVRKNSEGQSEEERGRLEVMGEYHLGEFVNQFRHGSLVMQLPDSETASIPTLIFGTVNGVIGVVASLPQDLFSLLHRLQACMTKVVKGVGGLDHKEWRSFCSERRTVEARNFIDGDLIESFLDLKRAKMVEIAGAMDCNVDELCKKVEEMTRLH